jgi:hypothetical protein
MYKPTQPTDLPFRKGECPTKEDEGVSYIFSRYKRSTMSPSLQPKIRKSFFLFLPRAS